MNLGFGAPRTASSWRSPMWAPPIPANSPRSRRPRKWSARSSVQQAATRCVSRTMPACGSRALSGYAATLIGATTGSASRFAKPASCVASACCRSLPACWGFCCWSVRLQPLGPAKAGKPAFLLLLHYFIRSIHEFVIWLLAAVIADLLAGLFDLVEIHNGRVIFVGIVTRQPCHDCEGMFSAGLDELFASHFREVDLLSMRWRRSKQKCCGHDGDEFIHGAMSSCSGF